MDCSVYFPPDKDSHGAKAARTPNSEYLDDVEDDEDERQLPPYFQCWVRRYGLTLFSLAGIFVTCSVVFYLAM